MDLVMRKMVMDHGLNFLIMGILLLKMMLLLVMDVLFTGELLVILILEKEQKLIIWCKLDIMYKLEKTVLLPQERESQVRFRLEIGCK
mgnify:CR=1 FL=1